MVVEGGTISFGEIGQCLPIALNSVISILVFFVSTNSR